VVLVAVLVAVTRQLKVHECGHCGPIGDKGTEQGQGDKGTEQGQGDKGTEQGQGDKGTEWDVAGHSGPFF